MNQGEVRQLLLCIISLESLSCLVVVQVPEYLQYAIAMVCVGQHPIPRTQSRLYR
jgi:hypothetical protein